MQSVIQRAFSSVWALGRHSRLARWVAPGGKESLMKGRFVSCGIATVVVMAFAAAGAGASPAASVSLKVRCSTSSPGSSSSLTESSTIFGSGTASSVSGTPSVRLGATVTCDVLVASPANATSDASGFTPSSTGPGGVRADVFTASSIGPATIHYADSNGPAAASLTFRYTITG